MSSGNVTFISNESLLYDLQQTGHTGVLIRLTSKNLTENSNITLLPVDDLPEDILLYNHRTKLYIPGCELTYTY